MLVRFVFFDHFPPTCERFILRFINKRCTHHSSAKLWKSIASLSLRFLPTRDKVTAPSKIFVIIRFCFSGNDLFIWSLIYDEVTKNENVDHCLLSWKWKWSHIFPFQVNSLINNLDVSKDDGPLFLKLLLPVVLLLLLLFAL